MPGIKHLLVNQPCPEPPVANARLTVRATGLTNFLVRFAVRLLGRLFGLVLVLLLMSMAYLHVRGFPPFLQRRVIQEFARAGIVAQFRSIHLDLFRGVVATDARLADVKDPQQPLAQIDQVQLQWNWRRMIRRQNFVGALRIANATVTIPTPIDEAGAAEFTAAGAYATVWFEDAGSIRIEQLSGVYCGIRLFVAGRLRHEAPAPRKKPAETTGRPRFVTAIVRELNRISSTATPQMDLDFDVDPNDPLAGWARLRLYGMDLHYRDVVIDSAHVEVEMSQEVIQIGKFLIRVGGGEITMDGRYDFAHGLFDVRLQSTADPRAFAAWLPPAFLPSLQEADLYVNPRLTLRYLLSPATGGEPQWQGTVQAGPLLFRNVNFSRIEFAFDSQWPDIRICNAYVATPEGALTGSGEYNAESSDFQYVLDSTLNPVPLLPLMMPGLRRIVEPASFVTSPHVVASVQGDFVDPDNFAYDAEVTAAHCSYRGVPMTGASGTLRLRQNRLTSPNLVLAREDGSLRGFVFADFNENLVRFDLESTTSPAAMAGLLGPVAARFMEPYRFGPNLKGHAAGTFDFDRPDQTEWTAGVVDDDFHYRTLSATHAEADLSFSRDQLRMNFTGDGVKYGMLGAARVAGTIETIDGQLRSTLATEQFSFWKLTAERARGTLVASNDLLQVDDFNADWCGGSLLGQGRFSFAAPEVEYQVTLDADRGDLQKLVRSFRRDGHPVSGLMKSHLQFQGRGTDLAALRGTGTVEIADAVLWEVPLFGVFSKILDDIAPGLGVSKATNAKATFQIRDTALHTDDLQISAGAFTLEAHGKVGLEGQLDFRAQARILKAIPGINIATALISKFFEYKVGGSLADPNYRPLYLPKEIMPHED